MDIWPTVTKVFWYFDKRISFSPTYAHLSMDENNGAKNLFKSHLIFWILESLHFDDIFTATKILLRRRHPFFVKLPEFQ